VKRVVATVSTHAPPNARLDATDFCRGVSD